METKTYSRSPQELYQEFVDKYSKEIAPSHSFEKTVYLSDKASRFALIKTVSQNILEHLGCMACYPEWVQENKKRFNTTLDKAAELLLKKSSKPLRKHARRICGYLQKMKTLECVDLKFAISNKSVSYPTRRFFIASQTGFGRSKLLGAIQGKEHEKNALLFPDYLDDTLKCLQMLFNENRIPCDLPNTVLRELIEFKDCYFIEGLIPALMRSGLANIALLLSIGHEKGHADLTDACYEKIMELCQGVHLDLVEGCGEIHLTILPQAKLTPLMPLLSICHRLKAPWTELAMLSKSSWENIKSLIIDIHPYQKYETISINAFPKLELIWINAEHCTCKMALPFIQSAINKKITVAIQNPDRNDSFSDSVFFIRLKMNTSISPAQPPPDSQPPPPTLEYVSIKISHKKETIEYERRFPQTVSSLESEIGTSAGHLNLGNTSYPAFFYKLLFLAMTLNKKNLDSFGIYSINLAHTAVDNETILLLSKLTGRDLEKLNLEGCTIDGIKDQVQKLVPNCKILWSKKRKHAPGQELPPAKKVKK